MPLGSENKIKLAEGYKMSSAIKEAARIKWDGRRVPHRISRLNNG